MNEKHIARHAPGQRKRGKTNWEALHRVTDDQAEAAALTDAENTLWSDEELRSARLVWPAGEPKVWCCAPSSAADAIGADRPGTA